MVLVYAYDQRSGDPRLLYEEMGTVLFWDLNLNFKIES